MKTKNQTLLFIGPLDRNNIPVTGDTMKNQLFVERFKEVFDKVMVVDTINWRKRPIVYIILLWRLITNPTAKIILSINSGSADRLIRFLKRIKLPNDIFYWVVGGNFHKRIERQECQVETYTFLKGIFVQGRCMEESLRKHGLSNVRFVPNSKKIIYRNINKDRFKEQIHFVFISRIEEAKGCTDIVKSVVLLNQKGYKSRFDVSFYGRLSENPLYEKEFRTMCETYSNIKYKGVLNLLNPANYSELEKYDVMLFPTYWISEGFPGVVIDAYIVGLPIIASDWNLNNEVINDNETGWLIPSHNVEALSEKMIYAIEHPDEIRKMSRNCYKAAKQYDNKIVLSEDNLKKLGVL